MSTENRQGDQHPVEARTPEELAKGFRLRPEYPRVTRLSRKVLATGSALGLAVIGVVVVWALQKNKEASPVSGELYGTEHHNVAEGVTTLPRDYSAVQRQVPQLGPPLPGDLGRPILAAQGGLPPATAVTMPDPEQQRRDQETEAARVSRVFVSGNIRDQSATATQLQAGDRSTAAPTTLNGDDGLAQNGQDRKLAFVSAPADRRTTSPDRITKAASPYVVQAGSVIPAALITGVRSDLPGPITAQITENLYDTPTGRFLLVPQGARLIGTYDSQVAFGQSRVLLVWTRLIMPNGRSIVLERQQGADAAGYSGLQDDVDNHWLELFKAAALSTLLAVGTELGAGSDTNGNDSAIIQALRHGAGDSLNQTGQQVVRRSLNVQPTLTVRPGFPVRVIVNRDLVLEPYRG
ncbi:type IV secretion system protein VirB10 [Bradyrhizobium elkanii USDA 61]|uniref:Type IV secretion system protein VirB10 n=1 Tax=Bradyrhizobium elkanii TaxID=29448 RepID=A0A8I1YAC8_BRAEL|nr:MULTISPECIES: TrbI/VirB10 family protein [Bradyrhizobium]MCA1402199.1 TrbI/VirB10 family protein [Bradyrhizobium sp. BRP56]MBP1295737.1 type IV secretion system protein VirB10 [Bradyrhizobium elkanii]MCP1933363.1 type IV secretion system protein VirB10 [Bradyrhizobium elkanii]MCS3478627.1 type IV secretion system protein VirB10 [Bradyrhizobium elkanii]MCS3585399.1 type IV secretion system protein VirB10 [Bradyrhizobium elkanii]